eukprot:CAMPEP_0175934808 /NCGR_PEP_ID=MMETSP0108-20121206/20692_1 /TAXON_ID=195067 ORGANISM="Goniomonas pacifica, Strain CCMP1869" /NCGR_SAMPLE_ID=MMETSP0108 /ASSEMBLY_ACC=CAM_ASM_000204 /LENGTH=68 /DNA_ID=CAMNT_0017258681 /DNA_START=74 /DNA_END=280 /DNA_ORIENTATION=-
MNQRVTFMSRLELVCQLACFAEPWVGVAGEGHRKWLQSERRIPTDHTWIHFRKLAPFTHAESVPVEGD